MNEIATPTNVGPTDGLALAQDRAAFERLVLQLTGRDMAYHARNGTTGLDTAWICYRGGVAAERERCAALCRQAMPQPVTNWSDAQIVEALRAVLEHVIGHNG